MIKQITRWIVALLAKYFDPQIGWATATDTQYTRENPFVVEVGGSVVLPNNKGQSITEFAGPYADMYDPVTQSFQPKIRGLSGSYRIDFAVRPLEGRRESRIRLQIDIGDDSREIIIVTREMQADDKFDPWSPQSVGFPFFCMDTFVANGGRIKISSSVPVAIADIFYFDSITFIPNQY